MVSISYEKITLSNGLDVILHQDHAIPLVAVNVWYHVGSKDEEPGRTGFAHLFEHVMFEGSKHHNSSHFEPLQKAGANLNGSTTEDRTNYWEDVPSNYLELALWLEADRMGFLVDALDQQRFDVQRDVVKNERRQSYENRPYGMTQAKIQDALFPAPHPYHWMTIGSQEDLDAASLDDIKEFFLRFYSPSNGSLAIAGDFERDHALELVERYFGSLPPGPPLSRLGRHDSSLAGRIELEMRDKVTLPRLYISWPTPPDLDPDDAPLDVLQAILSDGLSSRLHRTLVYEKQIAQSAGIRYHPSEIAGQFMVQVTPAEGHSLEEVEAATDAVMEEARQEPPTQQEMERIRNRIEASHYRQLTRIGGFGGRADQLNHFNVLSKDPDLINTSLARYMAVQAEDVQRVAQKVLDHRQVRLRVYPESQFKASTTAVDRTVMPPAAPEPAFTPPSPIHRKLDNGLEIVVVEKREMPVVSLGLFLKGGATNDPASKPGLASFTAQMLQEGTESRSSQELALAFEFIGARLSTDARREYAVLSTETMTKHWPAALDLMGDVLKNPTFPQHELDRVKREHLTDLRRSKDDANVVADQLIPSMVYAADSGYGHPLEGTEDAVDSFTREDIKGHFEENYAPSWATLIVVGDVTADQVQQNAEATFAGWSANGRALKPNAKNPDTKTGETTIFLVDRPGSAQSVIRTVHGMVPRSHPDYFGLTLLNYAFGGQFSARLNQNLRQDKGYSYGYHSSIHWYRGPSMLTAGGSVQTEVTKEAVIETLKEFQEVRDSRPITAEELDGAKAGLLLGYPASFERPGLVLNHLLQLVLFDLPDDYFQEMPARLSGVNLSEVHRMTSEHIQTDALQIIVVGDRETIEPGLNELEIPLVHLAADGSRL
jgi:zinc protease